MTHKLSPAATLCDLALAGGVVVVGRAESGGLGSVESPGAGAAGPGGGTTGPVDRRSGSPLGAGAGEFASLGGVVGAGGEVIGPPVGAGRVVTGCVSGGSTVDAGAGVTAGRVVGVTGAGGEDVAGGVTVDGRGFVRPGVFGPPAIGVFGPRTGAGVEDRPPGVTGVGPGFAAVGEPGVATLFGSVDAAPRSFNQPTSGGLSVRLLWYTT